ncbi:MAG: hypothetical protein ACLP01_28740 [Solirubrobacteraceae bacterium]
MGEDAPVLFSILGNTIANFPDEEDVLRLVTRELLKPNRDLLLVEVATASRIDDDAAKSALSDLYQ